MKKEDQYKTSENSDVQSNKESNFNQIKTTNVNILLNRVRLDQRQTLKKRILFSLFIATTISLLAVYFIV